jgi:hypothetical protein
MKYLHSGYILFCDQAEHAENGRIDTQGLFDLFVCKTMPVKANCHVVVGFGTPYERRQYKGTFSIENIEGQEVFTKEFKAHDPADIYKGHYIFKPEINLDKEGMWTAKVVLRNWKDEAMWDLQRQFWVMVEGDAPPDP